MPKPWKFREDANTPAHSYVKKCNCFTCPHCNVYDGCMISRSFKTCPDYHVRKDNKKTIT